MLLALEIIAALYVAAIAVFGAVCFRMLRRSAVGARTLPKTSPKVIPFERRSALSCPPERR